MKKPMVAFFPRLPVLRCLIQLMGGLKPGSALAMAV
jgi:hypothetical protein